MYFIKGKNFTSAMADFWYKTYREYIVPQQFISEPLKRLCKATSEGATRFMWIGGVRSLKSSGMMQLCGWHATGVYPEGYEGYRFDRPVNIMCVGLTFQQTKEVLQRYLTRTVDGRRADLWVCLNITSKVGVSGLYSKIVVPHFSITGRYDGNSELYFRSCQEGEKTFQGLNAIDVIFIDEEPKFEVYEECCRRIAAMNNRRTFLFISMWPASGRTELIQQFMNGREAGVVSNGFYYQHSGWSENPFLSEEAKTDLRKSQRPWMLPAVEFGIPVFGVGKVFEFSTEEILKSRFEIPNYYRVIAGVDPSATTNGTWGACMLALDPDSGCVYVTKEYLRSNLTIAEHAENIRQIFPEGIPIVCDPAGGGEDTETRLSALEYLKNKFGFNVIKAEKINKAKEKAVSKIYDLKRSDNFKIFDTCIKTVEEFERYVRDDEGKIVKENDHILDSIFYSLNKIEYGVSRDELGNMYGNFFGSSELMERCFQ